MMLAALLFIVGAGCAKKGATSGKDAGKETVIAEFDGGKVTAEEINTFIDYIASFNPMAKMELQDPAKKEMLINQIIESAVLAKAAKAEGIDKEPDVQRIIDLQINGLLASNYFNKKIKPLADKIQVADADMKQYYDAHPEEYDQTKIKVRHIIVPDEKVAQEISAKLKANPASFAALAKENSKDGSAAKGGDLGWVSRGSMVPEFEKVAFSLAKGQISEPFKTRFGWHIVMVDDKSELNKIPFEQAKESIKAKMMETKKRDAGDKAMADLKKKANLKVNKELFSKVGEQQPAMPGGMAIPKGMPTQPQR
jgi:peptidyl-prolyl cis-trans isomerase C